MDDAIGAAGGVIGGREDGLAEALVHRGVIEDVGGVLGFAGVRGDHGVVELVGGEPEEGLEGVGEVSVEAHATERARAGEEVCEEGCNLVHVHGLILKRLGAVGHGVRVDAHGVALLVGDVQQVAVGEPALEVCGGELAGGGVKVVAGDDVGHAVACGNHRAQRVVVPGEAGELVCGLWVGGHDVIHVLGVEHVEDEHDDVALGRDGGEALLGDDGSGKGVCVLSAKHAETHGLRDDDEQACSDGGHARGERA